MVSLSRYLMAPLHRRIHVPHAERASSGAVLDPCGDGESNGHGTDPCPELIFTRMAEGQRLWRGVVDSSKSLLWFLAPLALCRELSNIYQRPYNYAEASG